MGVFNEGYRPQFHFTSRLNWLNDPNGLVYLDGEYHLFFQHNPHGCEWGNMTWGHAVSPDLIHWKQLEHALYPDSMGTMFSGSAVVDWRNSAGFNAGGGPALVAIYTAAGDTSPESTGRPYTQCLAWSVDRGRTWEKYAGNPVLHELAPGNRDPKVTWHAPTGRWVMVLYLSGNDFAFLSSPDLKSWKLLHRMTVPGCDECPDFFEMPVEGESGERRWVWTAANGMYQVGIFDGKTFEPDGLPERSDYGCNLYAVQTFSDIPASDGRRIQIGWMRGGVYPDMPFNQQMSFPCELKLRRGPAGLVLVKSPVAEIELLRGPGVCLENLAIGPEENVLAGMEGDLWDIWLDVEIAGAEVIELQVRGHTVNYSVEKGILECLGAAAPLSPDDGRLQLRALVDRTSIEIYAGCGRVSLSCCFVPSPDDTSIGLLSRGCSSTVRSLSIYPLRSSWLKTESLTPGAASRGYE